MPCHSIRLAAALATLLVPTALRAETVIAGGNVGTQTWTAANSPYIVQGDITVMAGSTLTIEPGTEVRMTSADAMASGLDATRVEVTVNGALVVGGSDVAPVRFYAQSSSAAGVWFGIVAGAGATQVDLQHAEIRNAHDALTINAPGGIATLETVVFNTNIVDIQTSTSDPLSTGRIEAGRFNAGLTWSGGTLALNRPVSLVDGGPFELQGGGSLEFTLTGAGNFERLQATGDVTLAGTLGLDIGNLIASPGQTFTIIDKSSAGPVIGAFLGMEEGLEFPYGAFRFQITYAGGNGNDVVLTVVEPPAECDLELVKSAPAETTYADGGIGYALTVTNHGPATATGVTMRDSLPAGLEYVSAVPSQGSCAESGGAVVCALGDLAPAASASVTLLASFAFDTVQVVNAATVSSATGEINAANNTAVAATNVVLSTVAVDDPSSAAAPLAPVWSAPNPATGRVRVFFAAAPGSRTEVEIFDAAGRRVRTLRGVAEGGGAVMVWDGCDDGGARVRAGVYFYVARVNGTAIGRRSAVIVR